MATLNDVLITELPRIDTWSYDDLIVIDTKLPGADRYETNSITWGHLTGVYPPGGGSGGGDEIDNEIILRGQVKFLDGTELQPSITFIKDDNTGFYRPGNNTIGFTTGGTTCAVMRNQKMGIGTTTPDDKLEINEGNLRVTLGIDKNAIIVGSSTKNLGGDPAIRVPGKFPLVFLTNNKERFRIKHNGAFGLPINNNTSSDYGNPGEVLTSTGDNTAPAWNNIENIYDFDSLIGKGSFVIYDDESMTINGTDVSSGITVRSKNNPNANSFDESGWIVKLDRSVVRTSANQTIEGIKKFETRINMRPGSDLFLSNGSTIDFTNLDPLP